MKVNKIKLLGLFLMTISCVEKYAFPSKTPCDNTALKPNTTLTKILEKTGFGNHTFREDLIFTGYVVSDDKAGNFYKTLIIQDAPENPTAGLQIALNEKNLYLKYPVGKKLYIKTKGLSIGYKYGIPTLGLAGENTIESIHRTQISQYIFRACEPPVKITPKKIDPLKISKADSNQFVTFENAQFAPVHHGKTLAEKNSSETLRNIHITDKNCDLLQKLYLTTSGYARFASGAIPLKNGTITGVFQQRLGKNYLQLNDEKGIDFPSPLCAVKTLEKVAINSSISALYTLYENAQTPIVELPIQNPLVLAGFVSANDATGNFSGQIVLQDATENPTVSLVLLLETKDKEAPFQIGDKIKMKIDGLSLQKRAGVLSLGVFQTANIAPIPSENFGTYFLKISENNILTPKKMTLSAWAKNPSYGLLTTFTGVQLKKSELGRAFTYFSGGESAQRTLVNCPLNDELKVATDARADFARQVFPQKRGDITAIPFENFVKIRRSTDVNFTADRKICKIKLPPKILITEVADPVDKTYARFVEIHNLNGEETALKGWKIARYTNGSIRKTSVDLSDITLGANGFAVIGNRDFEEKFKMKPTLLSTMISGNGDDVYALLDPEGNIHDIYGVIGEDGTGKIWDYLDGFAFRKKTVTNPTPTFDASQWTIFKKPKGVSVKINYTPFRW